MSPMTHLGLHSMQSLRPHQLKHQNLHFNTSLGDSRGPKAGAGLDQTPRAALFGGWLRFRGNPLLAAARSKLELAIEVLAIWGSSAHFSNFQR